jgi:glycosyltransferase involved in cell wall biosynthesis
VVNPDDPDGFVAAARQFIMDHAFRDKCATAAVTYSCTNFDIERIGDRFENIVAGISS